MTTTETETTEATPVTEQKPLQKLTATQEVDALRAIHQFLTNFDRVPGSMAGTWSQVLDTLAAVANSLIAKSTESEPKTDA